MKKQTIRKNPAGNWEWKVFDIPDEAFRDCYSYNAPEKRWEPDEGKLSAIEIAHPLIASGTEKTMALAVKKAGEVWKS